MVALFFLAFKDEGLIMLPAHFQRPLPQCPHCQGCAPPAHRACLHWGEEDVHPINDSLHAPDMLVIIGMMILLPLLLYRWRRPKRVLAP